MTSSIASNTPTLSTVSKEQDDATGLGMGVGAVAAVLTLIVVIVVVVVVVIVLRRSVETACPSMYMCVRVCVYVMCIFVD